MKELFNMPGGSPVFPTADAAERKALPIVEGVLDYFPLALLEVAKVSKAGNDQHNPGQPLHWARGKSFDHANCIGRHLLERGTFDTDGLRHSAKLAWRALALLQKEIEVAAGYDRDGPGDGMGTPVYVNVATPGFYSQADIAESYAEVIAAREQTREEYEKLCKCGPYFKGQDRDCQCGACGDKA
jgi:hypothetical protein